MRSTTANKDSTIPLSLASLSKDHPQIYEQVISELKACVTSQELQRLGPMQQRAAETLRQAASKSRTGPDSGSTPDLIRSQMTLLAIEQFVDVMTGKVGRSPCRRDQLLMHLCLLRILRRGRPLSAGMFDLIWSRFKDTLWAAGELQRQGIWSVPTTELLSWLVEQANGRPILELGAGKGLYAQGLARLGAQITAVDNLSWNTTGGSMPADKGMVVCMDAATALHRFQPCIVLTSWPPPGNSFEESIFATTTVQLYVTVVSEHAFASGSWAAYKKQKSFACTKSELVNRNLRPLELNQQVLIFRRRS